MTIAAVALGPLVLIASVAVTGLLAKVINRPSKDKNVTEGIIAPWTEQQVAALNAFQRSGRMHPFTCGAPHGLHQTLIAETDGWHCPDEECDYRQNWAHAFMVIPGAADVGVLGAIIQPSLAAELRRVRAQLRETEDQLGTERRATADLRRRLAAAEARVTALEVHTAIQRVAAVDVPCGELLREQTITDVPTAGELL